MNKLEQALVAAAEHGGGPERTYEVGPEAEIVLADGAGHLLDSATLAAWHLSDVLTGRSE